MSRDYYLLVRTNTYVGNIDSGLMAVLFNFDDDRYGYNDYKHLYIENPEFASPAEQIAYRHPDADHDLPYIVNHEDTNTLEIALYRYEPEYIDALKQQWLMKDIFNFSIIGFALKTVVSETTIEEL